MATPSLEPNPMPYIRRCIILFSIKNARHTLGSPRFFWDNPIWKGQRKCRELWCLGTESWHLWEKVTFYAWCSSKNNRHGICTVLVEWWIGSLHSYRRNKRLPWPRDGWLMSQHIAPEQVMRHLVLLKSSWVSCGLRGYSKCYRTIPMFVAYPKQYSGSNPAGGPLLRPYLSGLLLVFHTLCIWDDDNDDSISPKRCRSNLWLAENRVFRSKTHRHHHHHHHHHHPGTVPSSEEFRRWRINVDWRCQRGRRSCWGSPMKRRRRSRSGCRGLLVVVTPQ